MLEHYLAIAFIVFVEHDAGMRGADELRQLALAMLDWPAAQILALQAPSDIMELWTAHTRKQFETLTEQTKELSALGQ